MRVAVVMIAVLLGGCAATARRAPAPPKTITVRCTVPFAQYEARTKDALARAGYTLVPEPEHGDEIEASRAAVYTGMGEGLQMNGPYRWDSRYQNGVISITVQTVAVNPDGSVYPSASHDERSPASDRKYFMPVVSALQQLCAQAGNGGPE
ncbi:MAG: hypothetical protein MUE41_15360 [Gemmatimonadaceae bacterium]|jgi:hypothetical protein|nr:hypothetical protein [Gemmatimonadaceae bacterium]